MAEPRGKRQHYACIYYDTELNKFFIENYEDGGGRDDGDIWDSELQEWRYASDQIIAGEEELDGLVWHKMKDAIMAIPPLVLGATAEEKDIVY